MVELELCANAGDELTGQQRVDWQLGHASVWRFCKIGKTYNSNPKRAVGVVCQSRGCNAKCDGYVKPEPDPEPVASPATTEPTEPAPEPAN